MLSPIRIGIAGLGTVGVGVLKILRDYSNSIEIKTGRAIKIVAVSAKSREKNRDQTIDSYHWESDPVNLALRDDIDIYVELIGGEDGVAKESIEAAISNGVHVVTANKALLAMHGNKLAKASEEREVLLKFEAAVAGGIPVIKVLNEALSINKVTRVMGVMNGSCNYILTRMEESELSYESIFKEADDLGFLESDPTLDVGGIDSAHKLAILSSLAFGTNVNFSGVNVQGIEAISIDDIKHASDMGFRIKLLGVCEMTVAGLEQRVKPCLVPAGSPLGLLEGGTNMVVIETEDSGSIILQGPGAGRNPTAHAVVSDIIDIINGSKIKTFGVPYKLLKNALVSDFSVDAPYYIRLLLEDKPGALAKVTASLGKESISINRMRQYDHESSKAPVLIVTHSTSSESVEKVLKELPKTGVITQEPVALRIEELNY